MPSSYLSRREALEAVPGDGVCPTDGCGKCQVLAFLARLRRAPAPECDARPGTMAEGLREYTYVERQALQAAIDAERKHRNATDPTKLREF